MNDLVIKNAKIIDGSGKPAFYGNVSVKNGVFSEITKKNLTGKRVINADGLMMLPGWVDIHTHYDGQATWDELLTPSSWHGVTTAVFGNCGVGFAPVFNGGEKKLINIMEGIEDIPETVLSEGIEFSWESFPEYLNKLESMKRTMDIGSMIPHSALRYYVMGEKGANHQVIPSDKEINHMKKIVFEALEKGALGFSTSRTKKHKSGDGNYTPSLSAKLKELSGIANALKKINKGIIEVNSDFHNGDLDLLVEIARISKRTMSVLLLQVHDKPNLWRDTLIGIHNARKSGININGQVGSRPIGMLIGFESSINPFSTHPLWNQIKKLKPEDRFLKIKNDKLFKKKLIDDYPDDDYSRWFKSLLSRTFKFKGKVDYEPKLSESILEKSKIYKKNPIELLLECMLENNGKSLLYHTFENYYYGNLDVVYELLTDEATVCGLGDAGAHVGFMCDASSPTSMIDFWARSREKGPKIPIELLVKKQTWATACTMNLTDRGLIRTNFKADFNLINFDELKVTLPEIIYDLPAGGKRVVQKSFGYKHTFVSGIETARDCYLVGNLPGKLIRK